MTSSLLRPLAPIFAAATLLCAACSAPPRQPVEPAVVDAPRGAVTIDSNMAGWVAVPNANQAYDWTSDGLLKYTFQVQNMTEHSFWFRYKTTFFDASGVTPVDEQLTKRQSLAPAEMATITVTSSNPAGKKVRVQILKDS